jgi:hypothetical protein
MDAEQLSMRASSLLNLPLALSMACASPRSEPPPDLAGPALAAAPIPDIEAPALPPVLPSPPPTSVGAFEMFLPVSREVSAEELGLLEEGATGLALRLELLPCRFAAAEPGLAVASDDACLRTNAATVHEREQAALVVHPGSYEFVVENNAFDRALGLWLRREDEPTLPVIAGGGATMGSEARWSVELRPGRYLYSCPLSPTPDYLLIVR